MDISLHLIKSTNTRIGNILITWYSFPICFDRRHDHPQGKLQDYERSKQTVTLRGRTARCYKVCHVRLSVCVEQLRCHDGFL
jgi:hypothetical protein